jgi:xylan 1,4-beta-xylosidase
MNIKKIIATLIPLSFLSVNGQNCSVQYGQIQNNSIVLKVDAIREIEKIKPIWAWFGYDEPNYTYMKDGMKLLTEISALSSVPVYVRVHNILTTDDGEPGLKWGSTNVYTEDIDGNPIYDWTKVDRILDTFRERNIKPILELGFMPRVLSIHPDPYRNHEWPLNAMMKTGWTYPPKDYKKWEQLIFQFTKHCMLRYGKKEIESWYWEVWNEPDISFYWNGTKDDFFKMYDFAVSGVKRVSPEIKVGGPTTTDPRNDDAANFYRAFLQHCLDGKNYVTGKKGSPLDYITFHAKGNPVFVDGHVQMNINLQLKSIAKGFEIISSFPKFKNLPIIIGESDPEGCAACEGDNLVYRNGTLYSSYQAAVFAKTYELADQYKVNLIGAVTWAFEFENKPWFASYRDLATNGVNKPVLNIYRMYGLMGGKRINVSGGKNDLKTMIDTGVKGSNADINALATKDKNSMAIMVWNYHDNDLAALASNIELEIIGLPKGKVLVHEYRIDKENSNSFQAWKKMGSPLNPTLEQITQLEKASQLMLFTSPEWITTSNNKTIRRIELPSQGVSLLNFSW